MLGIGIVLQDRVLAFQNPAQWVKYSRDFTKTCRSALQQFVLIAPDYCLLANGKCRLPREAQRRLTSGLVPTGLSRVWNHVRGQPVEEPYGSDGK